jgi:alpha-beta hydrolase superfamily lysophospholipase
MASSSKPVICLAHGAWHYPLYYRNLIDPLRAQGYTVLAPTNATVGIDDSIAGKTYVDDVKRIHEVLLPHLDAGKEAVMVCHSYGGIPGTAALEGQTVEERADKGLKGGVKAILYVAAVGLPQRGMSLYTLAGQDFGVWHRQEVKLPYDNHRGQTHYLQLLGRDADSEPSGG